jgi:hypothetical protein
MPQHRTASPRDITHTQNRLREHLRISNSVAPCRRWASSKPRVDQRTKNEHQPVCDSYARI